jgi:hypothetical protein
MANGKQRGSNKKILRQAAKIDDPNNSALVSSLTNSRTPETELLAQEQQKHDREYSPIDLSNIEPRLIAIVKTFCDLGQGQEFIKTIMRRLQVDELHAEVAQEWMLLMIRRGNEDALLHIATLPMPPLGKTARNVLSL